MVEEEEEEEEEGEEERERQEREREREIDEQKERVHVHDKEREKQETQNESQRSLTANSPQQEQEHVEHSLTAHANLSIGKLYMTSYEEMQRCKDELFVDLRIDAQNLSEEELRSWRSRWSVARKVVAEGETVAQRVMDDVKAFHERARQQRASIAEQIAEALRKSTEIEKFFHEQYEQERAQYVEANTSLLRVTTVSEIVTEDMKDIQAKGQEALQRVGEEIKQLQIKEAEILRTLK